jgi:hypothetical protein
VSGPPVKILKWKKPPDLPRTSKWSVVYEQLVAKPGEWALLGPDVKPTNVRSFGSRYEGIEVAFEALDKPGTWNSYVRYVKEK